ncbi:MAG: metallophosphoesterase [candidate division Zixibacteria bacterium]|nr:metallophosphoesterase [candidate division Zixibacteria bacterium]
MSELFPLIFSLVFLAVVGTVAGLFLRVLNSPWWEYKWIRLTAYLIPVFGGICIVLWFLGVKFASGLFTGIGASGAALTVVIQLAMLFSLPISGVTHAFFSLAKRLRLHVAGPAKPDPHRRLFLKGAAAVFPVAAISTGVAGVANSLGPVLMPKINFKYANLPAALDGLKILQLSDIHLGYYVILSDLEQVMAEVKNHKPDIVLLTGDIADDLTSLPYALDMIAQLKPRLGVYACLGNHEYYRGIYEVRQAYDKSTIPLLVNQGLSVDIDGAQLYVAGADDPRWLRRDNRDFLYKTIDKCIEGAPEGAFKLLMSHRPNGFDYAANKGVDLTLAGHTHGGQIGIAGRSVFEQALPLKYLWGPYTGKNGCRLYTTSGLGHWFPFRLGCPREAPIITLSRS